MPQGTGTIIYDPYRGQMKKKTDWWAVVEIDESITAYFRWWVNKEIVNPFGIDGGNLHPQSWPAHISVIRGERPPNDKMQLWKKYHKQKIDFDYDFAYNYKIGTSTNRNAPGIFFFVEIQCPFLIDMRREFGFKCDWPLHLTFARTYDSENETKPYEKKINN